MGPVTGLLPPAARRGHKNQTVMCTVGDFHDSTRVVARRIPDPHWLYQEDAERKSKLASSAALNIRTGQHGK